MKRFAVSVVLSKQSAGGSITITNELRVMKAECEAAAKGDAVTDALGKNAGSSVVSVCVVAIREAVA